MNAANYDNMIRIEIINLDDWERTVSAHQSYLWCHDLIRLIKQCHYELDGASVMLGDGNLMERIQWLWKRIEEAEDLGIEKANDSHCTTHNTVRLLNQEIENCSECHYAHDTHAISHGDPTCHAVQPAGLMTDYPRIPDWCPLPKAPEKRVVFATVE